MYDSRIIQDFKILHELVSNLSLINKNPQLKFIFFYTARVVRLIITVTSMQCFDSLGA